MQSDYKTCTKCGVRYSTLTRHRCIKVKKGKPPEFDDAKPDDFEHDGQGGGGTESHDQHGGGSSDDQQQGDSEGQGDSDQQGEGQGNEGQGDGESQGDGEGESQGDQQGEGQGEGEAPEPQSPDPEIPPVAVVCTVLKFAALTAACAKNGNIEITLAEDGLSVYGHNGDLWGADTIPWGEFEKRSTLDGEFYVKEIIDGVDAKLAPEKQLPEEPEPEAPKLTLPLKVGQRVVAKNGEVGIVRRVLGEGSVGYEDGRKYKIRMVAWDGGDDYWHCVDNGRYDRYDWDNDDCEWDIVADA